ncbi:MAG TPA: hypothetical protein VGR20_21070 [Acidimicrobiia bacterium]|nr:hypothetical protein [Acidimicrobiia bacterium]
MSPLRGTPSNPRRTRSRSRAPAVEIDRRALTRGSLYGLAVIAPVSIGVEVLDAVDVLSRGAVVFIPALAILGAFFLAGFQAAKSARGSPYTHGALAGLASFTAWLTLRMATHLVLGERLLGKEGDTAITVVLTVATVALLSMSGGILGGLLASRERSSP